MNGRKIERVLMFDDGTRERPIVRVRDLRQAEIVKKAFRKTQRRLGLPGKLSIRKRWWGKNESVHD